MKKIIYALCSVLLVTACVPYQSPDRGTWNTILSDASFGQMTENVKLAKKPIFQGQGGQLVKETDVPKYMASLEKELSDTLRKPGIQIQMVGRDVLTLIVRDAFMLADAPDISPDGADTLRKLAAVLTKYDRTFVEITGYTDEMKDQNAALAMSFDMAERVAVFLVKHNIKSIRLFVQGRGAARPVSDQSDIGRKMNRRVELRISAVK